MKMATETQNPRRWWALALLSVAQFLVILDTSIIGIALPEIQDALSFTDSGLSWVFNAYVIAFGGLLLLGGRLADHFGARRILTFGFAVLTGASLVAGLAQSDDVLILGRALQGVGAALIAPAAMALVLGLFTDPRELGKAMGIWGASAPAGGTAGVFLGGVITEWISWRWTFLINMPVAILALALIPGLIPAGLARRGRIDLLGAAGITGALSLAVYTIVTANDAGWASARTLLLFAASAVLLAAFVAIERVRREPLVRLGIFKTPNLAVANTVMALLGAAWIPMWFFLNLYLQRILGYDAFESGAALLPMTALIMLVMIGVTGRVVARYGFKSPMVVGLGLLAAGIALLGRAPVDGNYVLDVLIPSLIAAVGMSLTFIPTLIAALSAARPEEGGLASGLVNTTYQVGSALGLAVASAVAVGATNGTDPSALNDGYGVAFFTAAAIAVGAALLAIAKLRSPAAAEATGEVEVGLANAA
jgi:EmrB/QacA subfamily drug resistance transporter